MKRPRPYIPLKIRLAVAFRQCDELFNGLVAIHACRNLPVKQQIDYLLRMRFGHDVKCQLDHDPALILRPFNARTGEYTPAANDPAFLVWRPKPEHLEKTVGRKPGAERTITSKGSDMWLKRKFSRLEGPPRRKAKIRSRGFPKRKSVNRD